MRWPVIASKLAARVRNLSFRAKRRATQRFGDVELRQLKSLQRAYSRDKGPDLLVFGDSAMFWTPATDTDARHLVEMIRDELGATTTFEALVGPGYNPRIVMAFLSALPKCKSQPKVVLVPTSVLMACTLWLANPNFGYSEVAAGLRREIAQPSKLKLLDRPGPEALEDFDRLPAPSLYGARRTAGELRMIVNSKPETNWQRAVRTRHLMDYYNAEKLEPETEGVVLVGQLGQTLEALGLPSIAYIAPINHEMLKSTLGELAVEHMKRNADLIATTYAASAGSLGHVVNASADSPFSEFSDPVHLNDGGRLRLARRIAQVARPILLDDAPRVSP